MIFTGFRQRDDPVLVRNNVAACTVVIPREIRPQSGLDQIASVSGTRGVRAAAVIFVIHAVVERANVIQGAITFGVDLGTALKTLGLP